ncbi:MAG: Copper-bind protein [Acidobacteria bacterium]|nr:Copper-bind protein [Acidobacteriota bacterium]
MKRLRFPLLVLLALLLALAAHAAEPAKTGIVKGTITIGGRPTADAVVSIESPDPKLKTKNSKLKTVKTVLDQRDLKFIPRVLAVGVGTTVDFPNNDKTFHNVFSASEAKKFDLGLYPSGQSRSATFDKAGVVKILCNVHPNMEAYVVVKDHPNFNATDARGNYTLKGLPLGKYRMEVWHPEFGARTAPVELVREGEVLAVDLDLKK